MRELKRHLIGYAWVIALRELLRLSQIPVEIRRGAVVLAGLVTGPFVTGFLGGAAGVQPGDYQAPISHVSLMYAGLLLAPGVS